jgi:hypothetical protein
MQLLSARLLSRPRFSCRNNYEPFSLKHSSPLFAKLSPLFSSSTAV